MKRVIYIGVLAFMYVLLCSKSCNQREQFDASREEARIESARDSITSFFGADSLSINSLKGFEESAKLKSSDFWDYLNLLNDQKTVSGFKSQTRAIIVELFLSDRCTFQLYTDGKRKLNRIKIAEMVDSTSKIQKNIFGLKPDSIWISTGLHMLNDSTFAGQLYFRFPLSIRLSDKQGSHIPGGAGEIWALKREKRFGSETLKVWNVFLGNITLDNQPH